MSWETAIANVEAQTQQQVAAKAKLLHQDIMGAPPQPLGFVRHVDGKKNAPEESVKPGGVIVYDYNRLDQVAEAALDTLRQLSPADSGDYARSHMILLNGTPVDSLKGWKSGDTITISNPLPYTRKIELGRKGYRAHGNVYEKAERILARRFGNQASIYFAYRQAPPGDIHSWASTSKLSHQGHASGNTRQEWLTRQPTLVIREL